jgi:hypothetical protein
MAKDKPRTLQSIGEVDAVVLDSIDAEQQLGEYDDEFIENLDLLSYELAFEIECGATVS